MEGFSDDEAEVLCSSKVSMTIKWRLGTGSAMLCMVFGEASPR